MRLFHWKLQPVIRKIQIFFVTNSLSVQRDFVRSDQNLDILVT